MSVMWVFQKIVLTCLFGSILLMCVPSVMAAQDENNDPVAAMAGYLAALQSGKRDNLFPYLNGKSLGMMKSRPYSSAMMQREAGTIETCGVPQAKVRKNRAVVFFPEGKRQCSPYFMEYVKEFWRLDLYTMSQVIRFDGADRWHIDYAVKHPYMFAFKKKER